MSARDTSFFQQHIEKVILAVAVVIALAIAANYLLRDPYRVELARQEVSVSEVEPTLQRKAQQLQARLESNQIPPELRDRAIPQYTQNFRERWEQPLVPFSEVALALGVPLDNSITQIDPRNQQEFYIPRPPLPGQMVARAGYGMLGRPTEPTVQAAVMDLVGGGSRDVRYVSVAATFSMEDWIRRLQSEPPSNDLRRMRDVWWRNSLAVGGVYLQRQRLDPTTGEWGDTTIVQPLPTQTAFLEVDQRWDAARAEQALNHVKTNQPQVAQPEFLPLASPSRWLPPDSTGWMDQNDYIRFQELSEEMARLQTQMEGLQRAVDFRNRRNQAAEDRAPAAAPAPAPATAASEEEMSVSGPGSESRATRPGANTSSRARSGRQSEEQRLQELRSVFEQKQRERNELLGRSSAPAGAGGGDDLSIPNPNAPRSGQRRAGSDPFDGASGSNANGTQQTIPSQIKVWAHDVTVEPGATYRYRVIVTVLNPLFRQTRPPAQQQEQYQNKLVLGPSEEEIEQSPWSEPVQIDAETYFFIVGGSAQQRLARVEIWRLHGGAWRASEFDVQPGDPVGGEATLNGPNGQQRVPMTVDAVMVDLMETTGGSLGGGMRMLYLDRATNQMRQRSVEQDRNSPLRTRLQTEALIQQEMASAPRSPQG